MNAKLFLTCDYLELSFKPLFDELQRNDLRELVKTTILEQDPPLR